MAQETESIAREDVETQIIEAERQLRVAILCGDARTLDQLISDDLLFVTQTGQMLTKAQDLEAHRSGLLRVQTLELVEQQICSLGEVVVVVSKLQLAGYYSDTPFAGGFRYTRVWQRTPQGWRIAAGHASAVT